MGNKVKLIIEIPKAEYELIVGSEDCGLHTLTRAIAHGIPLDSNSDRAEVQAYFDGEAYGWEQGRKALIDDVKAEIQEKVKSVEGGNAYHVANGLNMALGILDNIGKAEKGGE